MRHERVIRAVGRLEEEGHARNQPKHGALRMRVGGADGDVKRAGEDAQGVQPDLFAPDGARAAVEGVGEEAAGGAADDVEEAEHGGPVAGLGLVEFGVLELRLVVGAQDAVDRELGAEGAEVACRRDQGLEAEDYRHGVAEGWLLDHLAAGCVQHGLGAELGFARRGEFAGGCLVLELLFV